MLNAATLLDGERTFLTSGGTETYLLFQQGFPMREFCAFEIFEHDDALARLEREFLWPILDAAAESGHGLLLDALVWRAHPDFVEALGYPPGDLARLNELAVSRTRASVSAWRASSKAKGAASMPVLLAADVGPRGDGYTLSEDPISAAAALDYHRTQVQVLAGSGVDLVCAQTLTSTAEAIGITRAAVEAGLPVVISPTVETDGRLPDGSGLGEFIRRVDEETSGAPLFYMVNCAHPSHLAPSLARARDAGERWLTRFRGLRANASRKSHAELDDSTELDRGDPAALARELAELHAAHRLRVVGGCCGTDAEHLQAIARAVA